MTLSTVGPGNWLRCYNSPPSADIRLVCFPHAGGSASYFFSLSELVTPSVEVLAVQYPGRQDRFTEPCIDNIRGLAERISEALLADPGPPLAFFGHSMGATVAFEVARGLRQHHGTRPRHLFVSGRRAPSCRRYEYVHLRDDAGVVAELRGLGGTAARWLDDKGFLDLILPTVRNDFKAIETYSYEPGPPLDCPVTALVGNADPYTSIAEAEAWRAHSTGDFSLQVFRGGHFYLDMRQTDVANLIMSALHGTPAKRN